MELQAWIIGQIIIDVLLVGLLLWFIKGHNRPVTPGRDFQSVIDRSEAILSEMQAISRDLDKNLEQKRVLSRSILEQLDEGLKRAERQYRQVSGLIRKPDAAPHAFESSPRRDTIRTRTSIKSLLEKGLSKEEISKHLGMSIGEIDLLLKLGSRAE